MGWAEDVARKAVQESRDVPVLGPDGGAPSEFLEKFSRGTVVDCVRMAKAIQEVLSPPAIVGPSGQAAARPDPVAVLLASQVRVLNALAALLDLELADRTGKPELRPVAPGNGNAPKPD